MILDFKAFSGAIVKVEKLADTQVAKYVLFDIKDGALNIEFSDGKKNLIEKLSYTAEEGDVESLQAMLLISNVREILNVCAGSGTIKVDEISLVFDSVDKLTVSAEKYYMVSPDGVNAYKKICSHISKDVKYLKANEIKGGTILTRFNYDSIFTVMDNTADIWDITELRDLLVKTSKIEAKNCYISSTRKAAYSITMASTMSHINLKEDIKYGFAVTNKMSKSLADILGLLNTDAQLLVVVKEKKFCYMMTSDDSFGIMFEMAQATRTEAFTLENYLNESYDMYSCVFPREALVDTIKVVMGVAKDDNTALSFGLGSSKIVGYEEEAEELKVYIERGDVSTSISRFSIGAVGYEDNSEAKDLMDLKFNINLKVFDEILKCCIGQFIKLNMKKSERAIKIKVCDCSKTEDGETVEFANYYTVQV